MKWKVSVQSFRIDSPSHPTQAKTDLIRFKSSFFFNFFQVELVLDMEETSPEWLRKRAHMAKHVEYPNRTSKVFITSHR